MALEELFANSISRVTAYLGALLITLLYIFIYENLYFTNDSSLFELIVVKNRFILLETFIPGVIQFNLAPNLIIYFLFLRGFEYPLKHFEKIVYTHFSLVLL